MQVWRWEDFVPALERRCIVLTPFCNETEVRGGGANDRVAETVDRFLYGMIS
jgi:hypothetical protein